ncbi:MAG TPA: AIR synthase-related protein [Candidatus Sulfotelmatobacter sp.]|nr:AIR synthase-related protein [Candidatus Sulfotelmatobacter sp.]
MGKLATIELQKLLSCIKKDSRVIVPPMPGFDAGVHLIGDEYLVVATDPCIGVPDEWFGWLLINYAASDVALFGSKPEFCTITLLGPIGTTASTFQKLMKQICTAADELDIAIVRGHTGTYFGLSTVLGVCTAYGTVAKEKLITPGNAKPNDLILYTKSIGLETLVNFTLTHKTQAERLFGIKTTENLSSQVHLQSCVKEALSLTEILGVNALHDATEGGLVAALNEMAEASKLGFSVEFDMIPISGEMLMLQKTYSLNDEQVLSASSTGSVIIAADAEVRAEIEKRLAKIGVATHVIGKFTQDKSRTLVRKGKGKRFPEVPVDPYERILSGKV